MKTLFIDTHLWDIHIMLFEGTNVYKEEHVIGIKQNSTYLMPSIKKVLDGEDFDQILIVNGPGSFTGVRLGVTVAKTLAYTMEKPIKVLSYFDLMNYSSNDEHHYFGIDDANGYFIGEYDNHKQVSDFTYINNNDFDDYKNGKTVETDVAIDYKKVIDALKDVPETNCHAVKPIYIKLIGVENDSKNNK